MKTNLILLASLIFSCQPVLNTPAFGRAARRPVVVSTPTPAASPVIITSPTPSASPVMTAGKVEFKPVDYYTTKAQRLKIIKAAVKMNEVVQSKCFYDFLSKRKMIQTNGRTPEQVAKHLQSLSGVIPVEMYDPGWFSKAVAYRQPPGLTIHLSYRYFYVEMDDCEWASTMAHESLGHSLGEYDHDFDWSPSREFSVPYSITHAFEHDAYSGSPSGACCH